ncbi:MAG: bleomycin resistance protein [Moraxellaceae bacterium]|nr:MAG: bleomycin resistance protein [Moraxellaceae bacterium]
MEITLNHTIVPTHDNVASAKFYQNIFGFKFIKEWHVFAVVKVNSTLTLDFMNKDNFSSLHYAFKVSEQQFDEILGRIKAEGIAYGSGPFDVTDEVINSRFGGRGVYFKDPNDHILEILTTDYVLD